jgi:hypothetical protein
MKIQIFTSVVNRPDFLEIQKKLFDKFLEDNYQFSIIDDSIDSDISSKFKSICDSNKINYYKSPSNLEHNNPSTKVGNVIQWAFDDIIKKEYQSNIVLWVDSDMFLIDNFNIEEYMQDCIISGLPQIRGHIKYMWNGLMFFNMPKIFSIDPDIKFNIDFIDGYSLDTGGETYHYFKKNNIEMKETAAEYPTHFNEIELQNEEVTKGYNFELHLNQKFLHYRAASNWNFNWRSLEDPLLKKTKIFNQIIEELLSE